MNDQKDNFSVEVIQRQSHLSGFNNTTFEFVIKQFTIGGVTEINLNTVEASRLSKALNKAIAKHSILPPSSPGEDVKRWIFLEMHDAIQEERYRDAEALRYIVKCVNGYTKLCKKPMANINVEQLVTEVVNQF